MLGLSLSPLRPQAAPDPLAPFFAKSGGQLVALAEAGNGGLSVWSELGAGHAAWMTLDNADPSTRLSWRETLLAKLRRVYPIGQLTLTGSWNQLQSSGSGLAASYTGNRGVSTGSSAATAEVTVERDKSYDLWVHYTGRTSGGYVRVLIDGEETLVNEIADPAALGFKAFSTYAPIDLQRRQVVRVASGLTGAHQISLSYGGAADPGGAAILIEAVSISADLSDPGILPPIWQPGQDYTMGDEVQWKGTFYSARATGMSGASAPAHTSGIGSDGSIEWRADNRPTYPEFVAIDYASEREYAARFAVDGVSVEVGGQTHGNEPLSQRSIALDGASWDTSSPTNASGLSVGSEITIDENTQWQMPSGTPVADCALSRTVVAGEVRHDVAITPLGPTAEVEWFYAGMLPMVHWDGESASTVVEAVTGGSGKFNLADYSGQIPPNFDLAGEGRIGLTATVGTSSMLYGLSVTTETGGLTSGLSGFLRANIDGRLASGSLDWPAKAYVSPSAAGPWSFAGVDALSMTSRHVMSVR